MLPIKICRGRMCSDFKFSEFQRTVFIFILSCKKFIGGTKLEYYLNQNVRFFAAFCLIFVKKNRQNGEREKNGFLEKKV